MSRNNENALSIHLPMRYIDAELLRLVDLTKFRSNHWRCSVKAFLKTSQNSKENICTGVTF